MSGLIMPQVIYGLSNEELAELVAKALKELDWFANGNISDQNISRIANFLASKTEFKHISGLVGLSGYDPSNPLAVRLWSGDADKSIAKWRVLQNGAFYATDAFITGLITGSTIIGGLIKTADTGARIELTAGVLKGYSEANNLHGLVFSPTPDTNIFDLFLYHDGIKLLDFIDNVLSITIKGSSSSTGMTLGGSSAPTFGAGSWTFTGDTSFSNPIDGNITGNAATANYASNAGVAAAADSLAPMGNIAWGQVLKSGSNLADLATRNMSSLTEDSTHRSVSDSEKATWNAKWGNDTTASRSSVLRKHTVSQSLLANTLTKINFTTNSYDNLGETDSIGKFTAAAAGEYRITVHLQYGALSSGTEATMYNYVNGSSDRLLSYFYAGAALSFPQVFGTCKVKLSAGDTLETYAKVTAAQSTNADGTTGYLEIERIS